MHAEGAELAFSHQGEAFGKRVAPLAAELGSELLVDVDVTDDASMDACFARLAEVWGRLDFVVHAIAYSDKHELTGRFIDTSRENFRNSLTISCYSLIDVAKRAKRTHARWRHDPDPHLPGVEPRDAVLQCYGSGQGGTGIGGPLPCKRSGAAGIRVNAISPGPMTTLAGAAIGGARKTFKTTQANAPLRANATLEAVGGTAVYLASDYGACTTGETVIVDGGFHVLGMLQPENL